MTEPRMGLFEGVGIELEYMIVDDESLAVRPCADTLMRLEAGDSVAELERGELAWSNELVLHVLEIKTNGPAPALAGLAERFQGEVLRANEHLASLGARLLPSGMHPFMDPEHDTRLWPHEFNEIYRTFDRIFGCRSHGWANLQSTHINLPFSTDDELARLHAAVRAVLPLVPALAASSPYRDGSWRGSLDGRLAVYRKNAARVPSVSGQVIPEVVKGRRQYEAEILGRIYADLAPLDPDGVLRHEWVNARGAIVRLQRGSIEIRLIDAQECPLADLAVSSAIFAAVRWLTEDPPAGWVAPNRIPTGELAAILGRTIRSGDSATVAVPEYLRLFGLRRSRATAATVWRHIVAEALPSVEGASEWAEPLELILDEGCLARRIVRSVGRGVDPDRLLDEYRRLSACLAEGRMYAAHRLAGHQG